MISRGTLRIDGRAYRVLLTREYQRVNGRQVEVVLDCEKREIRIGRRVRNALCKAIRLSREAMPANTGRHRNRKGKPPVTA